MELNKSTVINNIYTLAKNKGMKLGELEAAVGISTGYLAKVKSDENRSVPGVEILAKIAHELGVTLDLLISTEIDALNTDEKFTLKFIDDLITKTESGKIFWSRLPESMAYGYHETEEFYAPDHPMFELEFDNQYGADVHYISSFYGEYNASCQGDSYRAEISKDVVIYLMSINVKNHKRGPGEDELELYMYKDERLLPLCCKYITPTFSPFKDILEKMYKILDTITGHQTVSYYAMEEMADFMGVDIPDDYLPF